jgi:hypothetical protein
MQIVKTLNANAGVGRSKASRDSWFEQGRKWVGKVSHSLN